MFRTKETSDMWIVHLQLDPLEAVSAATDRARQRRNLEVVRHVVGVMILEQIEKTILVGTDDLFCRWHSED